jgi:uncharacterized protein (DUF2249 family)
MPRVVDHLPARDIHKGGAVPGADGMLTVDIRAMRPDMRRPVLFSLVDRLVALGWNGELLLVCEHEPAGLTYQLDLRKETRGRFEYDINRRSDGAWVAMIRPKKV